MQMYKSIIESAKEISYFIVMVALIICIDMNNKASDYEIIIWFFEWMGW